MSPNPNVPVGPVTATVSFSGFSGTPPTYPEERYVDPVRTAHFTLTELPGTLLIWASGIALGAAFFSRGARRLALSVALMTAVAAILVG